MTCPWPPETQGEVGNALIVAQNALAGYAQVSNGPETEAHHQAALRALGIVQQAIRSAAVLEQQGIVPGVTIRFTDSFKQLVEPEGPTFRYGLHLDGPNREGEVLRVTDGVAEVVWNDVSLLRRVKTDHIEVVPRALHDRLHGGVLGPPGHIPRRAAPSARSRPRRAAVPVRLDRPRQACHHPRNSAARADPALT
ncbi:hypothetical protein ACYOEI_08515 [Singulisphaera rosea]